MLRLCAFVAAVFLAATAQANAATFGAIAFSAPTSSLALQSQCSSRGQCERAALNRCYRKSSRPRACRVLVWFKNACGAFAGSRNGAYGTGWGNDVNLAMGFAEKVCRQNGGRGCHTSAFVCSNGAPHFR